MPELIHTIAFGLAFLMVLATIRKFLMITGHERFSEPRRALIASYRNFTGYAVVNIIAGTLGFFLNQMFIAAVVIIIVSAVFYGMASMVYASYKEVPR